MSQPPWPLTASTLDLNPLVAPGSSRQRAPAPGEDRRASEETRRNAAEAPPPIIAFCHLSWDWVWQRPQQFLSRLAQRHRVLFVETYCAEVAATRVSLRSASTHSNVTILRMEVPATRWSDGAFIDRERRQALQVTLAGNLRHEFQHPLLWFYDPMAVVAFAGQLDECAIVYDCMDELAQFRGAPPELALRERELLARADVVFCGGQKMRKKRLPLNPNTHFFGTGVDLAHFGQALSPDLPIAPELAALGRGPVLGYFGVVDERIDYDLLAQLADAREDWHIAMVGPVAKVNPADFPRRPNLHWLGGRSYADLPALTKGFSLALMPFARNAATEFINPTKALEYMAAGRPVVSTALDEVRLNFGRVVRIADTPREFVSLCAREIAKPSRSRIDRGLRLAADNTWEAIVAKMEDRVAEALGARRERLSPASSPPVEGAALPKLAYV